MQVPKNPYKRRKPTRKQRNNFSAKIRKQIIEEEGRACQSCFGRPTQIHHVMPRGRNGRGVYQNAMAICDGCHAEIHQNNTLLNKWIEIYKNVYGDKFWLDEYDKE